MKHLTQYRSRANGFETLGLAIAARERLFPEPDLTACYHGLYVINAGRTTIIEMFRGSESIGYVREVAE